MRCKTFCLLLLLFVLSINYAHCLVETGGYDGVRSHTPVNRRYSSKFVPVIGLSRHKRSGKIRFPEAQRESRRDDDVQHAEVFNATQGANQDHSKNQTSDLRISPNRVIFVQPRPCGPNERRDSRFSKCRPVWRSGNLL